MTTLGERVGGPKRVVGGPFGSNLTSADYTVKGVPVIRGSNMEQNGRWIGGEFAFVSAEKAASDLRSNIARRGDIIVTQRGTMGQVSIVPDDAESDQFVISQSQMAISVDATCASRDFVYYYLRSPQFAEYLTQSIIQTGVPHINLGILRQAPVEWPQGDVQELIAGQLRILDDKIELNRRMNETLEAMAQALFRDWFVDFGPVRRKLAGETDPVAIMGGLTPDPARAGELTALFPDAFDANDLPEGFELCCLEDTVSILETGRRPKGGIKGILTGVPSIGAESIVGLAKFDYGKTKYVPRDFFASMKRGVIGDRDIVLYKDGGRPGEFEPHVGMFGAGFPFEQCCINEHVYRVVGAPPFSQEYLYLHLSSDASMEEMRNKGTGVAIPGLNSTAAKSLIILHPGEQLLDAFTGIVRPMIDAALHNANENRTLAETRDYLLPRLMSGQVRVTASHIESAAA